MTRSLLLSGLLLLTFTACTNTQTDPGADTGSSASSVSSSSADLTLDTAYADPAGHFTVRYPANWELTRDDTLITPNDEYNGTAFMVPPATYAGTNLNEAKIHLTTQPTCPVMSNSEPVVISGRTFTHSTWTDAGAGNLYMGESYALESGDTCVMATLFTHRCNLGPDCGEGRTQEFTGDTELQNTLRQMAESIAITHVQTGSSSNAPVICTMDAKQCPDGSFVGRIAPNCEFAACPGEE